MDFPIAQHKKLKIRAALEGITLQDYIRSRVTIVSQVENVSDRELNHLANEIIEENKEALKRLADK